MHTHIVPNVSDKLEHCAACDDTGWVELTHDRGMAPCKWCELGIARSTRHPELLARFDGTDIVPHAKEGEAFVPTTAFLRERESAGVPIPALQAMFPRKLWPPEWPADAVAPSMLGDLNEPNRPYHAENDPIAADATPQEPISADEDSDLDQEHAENPDEEAVPW